MPFVVKAEFTSGPIAWIKESAVGCRYGPRENATTYKTRGEANAAIAKVPKSLRTSAVRFVVELVDVEPPSDSDE